MTTQIKTSNILIKRNYWIGVGVAAGMVVSGILLLPATRRPKKDVLTKQALAEMIGKPASFYKFPTEVDLPGHSGRGIVQYSFDPRLQEEMEKLLATYHPDYGAFVAMDAETGQILSMVSFQDEPETKPDGTVENLALRSTFPSASVFKVVTAAAAIETERYSPDTMVSYNGSNHTLYRGNVLKPRNTRWTRTLTLKEAFANSINTVFARIGAYTVGPATLKEYAGRFGFNRQISADFPVQAGRAPIPNDAWGLAETASGFTRDNTMSPCQGAMIAAAIVNDGKMMEPYLVQSVYTPEGTEIYQASPSQSANTVDPRTAEEIRVLMRQTVAHGTSTKSFRGFARGKFSDLDVGGKTGSLTGTDPAGKYDWYVGYARGRGHKLAFAALTIHKKVWRVKSSYLVRQAIENYYKLAERDATTDAELKKSQAEAVPEPVSETATTTGPAAAADTDTASDTEE
jgi:peptidoglycan glycosyltransferase